MKKMKRNKRISRKLISGLLLCMLVFTLVAPTTVFAAGPIEPNRDASLTVYFKDGTTPIAGTNFDIYKVADTDEYAKMTLTSQFSSYPVDIDGLDQKGWQELATTLNGYAKRDNLAVFKTEIIDGNGEFTVTLQPGLYLVVGERKVVGEHAYSPVPFMIFLPGSNTTDNTWDYNVAADVKYTEKEIVTLKALKIWDDNGFEAQRPKSVTVQLLCDGKVYDTQELSEENLWRYTWKDLPEGHEWLVVEKELSGYYTKVSQEGITFTITNKYIVPLAVDDPPVVKKLVGDTPKSPATFTFVFKAENDTNPMPEGSTGNTKELNITGSGYKEIGKITFAESGVYSYTIYEKDFGATGYTYDKTVYTITYTITEKDGELLVSRKITESNGKEVDAPVFTNRYTEKPILPQTGVLWWPVPTLFCTGLLFCIIGTIKRRLRKDEK